MSLPKDGKHKAKCTGKIIYAQSSGKESALQACIPIQLVSSEVEWSGVARVTLIKKDGTVFQSQVDNMAKIFGACDGNIFWLEDLEDAASAPEFEVDGFEDEYTPEGAESPVKYFKINWVNPIGGRMPEPIDDKSRAAIQAKHGSKFKALFAGKNTTAKKPEVAKASTPTKSTATKSSGPPPRPSKSSRKMSADDFFNALKEANSDLSEDEVASKFYDIVDETGKEQSDISEDEWGNLATKHKV